MGYSVVAYTDHDVFLDQQHLTDENFVALNGTEYYFNPEIHNLYYEDGKVYINTSDCDRITLGCSTRKNRNVWRTEDTLTHAEFDIRPEDKYIRFTVTDKYGKTASTNAYFLDDFLK